MKTRFSNEDGFSLIEIIMSIAALAVISVFILQMFVVSANANKKAQNMDIATSKALGTIENFLSGANEAEDITYFDADWEIITNENNARFIMHFDVATEEPLEIVESFSEKNGVAETSGHIMKKANIYVIDTEIEVEKQVLATYNVDYFGKVGKSKGIGNGV